MVSLNRRFNMIFLLLVVVPLIAMSVFLSRLYMEALLDTVSGQTQDLLSQVAQNVEKELNDVSVLAAVLLYDQDLTRAAKEWSTSPVGPRRIEADWRMSQRLEVIFALSNRKGAIVLYMRDGSIWGTSNYPNIRSFELSDRTAYREAKANPNHVVIADSLSGVTENGGERFILSAIICPGPDQENQAIDAILVMARVPYLDEFSTSPLQRDKAGLIIVGRDGGALLSSFPLERKQEERDLIQLARGSSERNLLGKHYLVNARRLDMAPWTLVLAMDRASITGRITRYQWYLYPALLLMVGLFLGFSMVFFSRVSKPIHTVIDNMKRFAAGEDPGPTRSPQLSQGISELSSLTESFDSMVSEIRRLEAERTQQSERRLAAEIQALQFQISPHFIANTLNSIRMMALAARNDGIRDMTQALIRILAESYTNVSGLTTLANEIRNLENYLAIMKVRFGEHFEVVYELEPATLDYQVLRMSLQPLVENSILHGFAGLDRPGILSIRSRCAADNGLVLEVADNGEGMEETILQGLLAPAERRETIPRIGVQNVHERIRLNFGERYGLSISSQAGSGTTVVLRLPCLRGSEG